MDAGIAMLAGLLTEAELGAVRCVRWGHRTHPLSALLASKSSQTAGNTGFAARQVLRENPGWLERLKPRLADTSDPTSAASALAELRAYGALLEAGFGVTPVGGKTVRPEFRVRAGDEDGVTVEVYARQIAGPVQAKLNKHHDQTQAALKAYREDLRREGKERGVFVSEPVEIAPFGDPTLGKPGDTVVANAISKLCRAKEEEHQFDDKGANVLWLDLQDDYSWGLALEPGDAHPFRSSNCMVTSGALWYAFYGWKGAPILEPESGGRQLRTPMGHDGRFAQSRKLSALIATFPRALVVMEHPGPAVRLGTEFRLMAKYLPHARIELWICEWEPGLVETTVEIQKRAIAALAENLSGGRANS